MFTIEPWVSRRAGRACLQVSQVAFRFTARLRSKASSVRSVATASPSARLAPTLLCRMSIRPKRSRAAAIRPSTSASRVTSAAKAQARPPSAAIRSTVSCAEAIARSTTQTCAPSRPSTMAALPSTRLPMESGLLRTEAGGADPAGLGDIQHDPVRPGVLDLDVGVALIPVADAEGVVDVVAARRARRGQPQGDLLQAVHLEADVVDARELPAPLDPGHRVVLEVQHRQVEIAVGQEEAADRGVIDAPDLLHAEDVHVELGRLLGVLGGQRDVLDLRHGGLLGPSLLPRPRGLRKRIAVGRRDLRYTTARRPIPRAVPEEDFDR